MEAEPGSVVTVVRNWLSDFLRGIMSEDLASSGNGAVLCSTTLTKLTLPHDAKSVVQNKKGTKNQTKETPTNTHKGMGRLNTQLADCRIELLPVLVRGGVICS